MRTIEFNLDVSPFIELNKLLKLLSIAESGGIANQIITDELITLNGVVETRKRCKLKKGDVIKCEEYRVEVKIK